MESIYLFGVSTTAIRIRSFIEYHKLFKIEGFIVDDDYYKENSFEGYKVISFSEFKELSKKIKGAQVFICLAWNRLNQDRKKIFEKLTDENIEIVNLISPLATIRGAINGRNVFIGDYVTIEVASEIKSNVFIDHHGFIGTATKIDKHAYIGAKSTIAGDSYIGEQSFLGINSTVFDQVKVGKMCIISGGEVIKRNVIDCSVVKTNSTEQKQITYLEDEIINKLISSKNVR